MATLNGGSRKVIGVVSVVAPGDPQAFGDDAIRLGYYFAPEEWGRGYATEAVQAVVDGVFLLTATKAIVADARVVNPASSRVLQKCGFAFQGSNLVDLAARGGFFPVDTFRLDRKVVGKPEGLGNAGSCQPQYDRRDRTHEARVVRACGADVRGGGSPLRERPMTFNRREAALGAASLFVAGLGSGPVLAAHQAASSCLKSSFGVGTSPRASSPTRATTRPVGSRCRCAAHGTRRHKR